MLIINIDLFEFFYHDNNYLSPRQIIFVTIFVNFFTDKNKMIIKIKTSFEWQICSCFWIVNQRQYINVSCVYGHSHFHIERIIYVLKCSEARISNCCFVPEAFSPHPLICHLFIQLSLFDTASLSFLSLFYLHFSWHFLFYAFTFSFAPLFHFKAFVWVNFLFALFLFVLLSFFTLPLLLTLSLTCAFSLIF